MWGIRVIIPENLQPKLLKALYLNHPGITHMKAVARSYFWWASLDKAVEELARFCSACQAIQAAPAAAPLLPWAWPDVPWKQIHVDFAGLFLGKMSFLIVDAHSKWPSCLLLHHDAQSMLCNPTFSHYGLLEQLVSDNSPQFTSDEFAGFIKASRVKHMFLLLHVV